MWALIQSKPVVGYVGAGFGALSGLLTLLKVLTPLLGFAGAVFGAAAGLLTLLIKWREYKDRVYKDRRKLDDRDDRIREDNKN